LGGGGVVWGGWVCYWRGGGGVGGGVFLGRKYEVGDEKREASICLGRKKIEGED